MAEVAILIPCYNEIKTIGAVIEDFGKYMPYAHIYVYDNNSVDGSYKKAMSYVDTHKLTVKHSPRQGKGNVVKHMFKEIKADIYVMCDADSTYHAKDCSRLVAGIENGSAMVLGDRLTSQFDESHYRKFHTFGNKLVRYLVNRVYHGSISDVMTGYRAMSREFVQSIDVQSHGFEIETELCIHALKNRFKITAVPIVYTDRPDGSESKLNTLSDGMKVLETIVRMR